ncbi:MAG: glycosyltransferase family 2 protein [Lachnospiraceae bacterium]|nr:glycosyltransferase family 2 protein [Lachnospiraceae bacterium]
MNDYSKKVSVIVPVYNASKYLHESLGSILGQTYKNIELICVNDGSTDDSLEVLKSYQKKDERVIVISQTNMHAGVARNNGFSKAQGKYVIFLDADDRFNSQLVEKMVKRAEETSSDIVICSSEGFDGNTGERFDLAGSGLNIGIIGDKEQFSVYDIPENVFQLTCGWSWDKLYLRDFLVSNNLKYTDALVCEDAGMVFKSYAVANKMSIVSEKLICHRKFNGKSLDENRMNSWHSVFDMLFSLKDFLWEKNIYDLVQKSFKRMAAEHIIYYLIGISDKMIMEEYVRYFRNVAIEKLGINGWNQSDYSSEAAYKIINYLCDVKDVNNYMKALRTVIEDREKGLYYLQKKCNSQQETIEGQQKYIQKLSKIKRWNFDTSILEEKPRVIVYGYGDVGRDYCKQILEHKSGVLVMAVDSQFEQYKHETMQVHKIEDIINAEFDVIMVAVYSKTIAQEIRGLLINMGVPRSKIVWFNLEQGYYE